MENLYTVIPEFHSLSMSHKIYNNNTPYIENRRWTRNFLPVSYQKVCAIDIEIDFPSFDKTLQLKNSDVNIFQ